MKKCTIRRANFDPKSKWLELWLDGLEYTSEETIWDDESQSVKLTGDKQWNFSCKRGYFETEYFKTFLESPDYSNLIGLKLLINNDDLEFINEIEQTDESHNNLNQN